MRNYTVDTAAGPVVFMADAPNPRVLAFHGFQRRVSHLAEWRHRIPGLGFVNLPGHGDGPPLRDMSLTTWVAAFSELMATWEQPLPIIAESLGAVIAMSIPSKAVIAVEPPLSVKDLWPLQRAIYRARERGQDVGSEMQRLFERPFHWVLARIQSPTLVLAGDEPLLPPRQVPREPSILTDDDFQAYADHPRVEALRIPGGHTLMSDNAEAIMSASRPFMIRHGYLPPGATP